MASRGDFLVDDTGLNPVTHCTSTPNSIFITFFNNLQMYLLKTT